MNSAIKVKTMTVGALVAAGLILAIAIPCRSDDQASDRTWEVEASLYAWIPEIDGRLRIGNRSAPITASFDDVFDLIGAGDLFGAAGSVQVHRNRLGFFVDAFGALVDVEEDIPSFSVRGFETPSGRGQVQTDLAVVQFGLLYRVLDLPLNSERTRSVRLEPMVGGRYGHMRTDIDISVGRLGPNLGNTSDFVDPIIGGQWSVGLLDDLDLYFWGDIGGFDVSSHLTWSLIGAFQYQLSGSIGRGHPFITAGYRVLDYNREDAGAFDEVRLQLRGPILGFGLRF